MPNPHPEVLFPCVRFQDRRVVICESMVCPRELREAVGHVLFRYLQVGERVDPGRFVRVPRRIPRERRIAIYVLDRVQYSRTFFKNGCRDG